MHQEKRDPNQSETSDEFIVHSGPSHVSDWPLGTSASHDHFIEPVPPYYITEYEASYKWPSSVEAPLIGDRQISKQNNPNEARPSKNDGVDEMKDAVDIDKRDEVHNVPLPSPANPSKGGKEMAIDPWQVMEQALDDLTFLEKETAVASDVKTEVHSHKLNDKIEQAYSHYKNKLRLLQRESLTHGIRKEVLDKIRIFCDSVEAVKHADAHQT